ncbi:Trimeric GatFAB AmidoTransferase(AdT) complex subunit, partial [Tulasnella sp. 403]
SLDCVGVLAKSTERIKLVFNVVSKYDKKDPTSIPEDIRSTARSGSERMSERWGDRDLTNVRIGIPQEYFPREMDGSLKSQFRKTLKVLKESGAQLVPVSLPSTKLALSAYYVLASAEASSNLARYDGVRFGKHVPPPQDADRNQTSAVYAYSRSAGFGPEVRKRILLGTYALTAEAFDNYYLQAQRIRNAIRDDFDAVFSLPNVLRTIDHHQVDTADILLHPTAINSAAPLSGLRQGIDGYVQDILTTPASLAGLPCLSVPAGIAADGWPIGVSIVGQWGSDDVVLDFGKRLERLISEPDAENR